MQRVDRRVDNELGNRNFVGYIREPYRLLKRAEIDASYSA